MNAVKWMVGAVAVLGLGVLMVVIGMTLLPVRTAVTGSAAAKLVPWYFTWGLIWTTVLMAVAVAGSLVVTGVAELHKSR